MRIIFLGTGTSRGIPVIGCDCDTCKSSNPVNKRLRSSVLVEDGVRIVIDTPTDFRQQMLRFSVPALDAVVYTHHHADHVLGLDDLFPFCARSGRALPIFGRKETLDELRLTFRHVFADKPYPGVARLAPVEIEEQFQVGGLTIEPIEVLHGGLPINGYRIGGFAYLTDVNQIPAQSMEKLKGLRYLAIDGLRYRRHRTHYSVDEAVEVAHQLEPEQAFLIHLSHDVEHEECCAHLPAGVSLAYDGMVLEL